MTTFSYTLLMITIHFINQFIYKIIEFCVDDTFKLYLWMEFIKIYTNDLCAK